MGATFSRNMQYHLGVGNTTAAIPENMRGLPSVHSRTVRPKEGRDSRLTYRVESDSQKSDSQIFDQGGLLTSPRLQSAHADDHDRIRTQ